MTMVTDLATKPKIKPPHFEIDSRSNNKWDGAGRKIECSLYCRVNCDQNGESIPLYFAMENTYSGFSGKINGTYANCQSIDVPEDCTITVNVEPSLYNGTPLLRMSPGFDVITLKKNATDADAYYDGWDEKQCVFRAKGRPATTGNPTRDGFNLNVELYQGKDSDGVAAWLPITLDPDIINPKPPQ
jgi:hypothetical protein